MGARHLGDFAYTILLGAIALLICGWQMEFVLLGDAMAFFVMGAWCSEHSKDQIPLLWAIPIPAWVFPWFVVTLYYSVGGALPIAEAIGLILGFLIVGLRGTPLRVLVQAPSAFKALLPQKHAAPKVARWGCGQS